MNTRFFKCNHCGQIIGMIENKGVPVICCGEHMEELVPGVVEASHEKHIPLWEQKGNTVSVNVGAVAHPMSQEHHIAWVYVATQQGGQRKNLAHDAAPVLEFALTPQDKVLGVYAYCNLHGLWLSK